jgi:hypothetical protein
MKEDAQRRRNTARMRRGGRWRRGRGRIALRQGDGAMPGAGAHRRWRKGARRRTRDGSRAAGCGHWCRISHGEVGEGGTRYLMQALDVACYAGVHAPELHPYRN